MPVDGEAEQPVIVQVKDGAPVSATVTVIVTVTEAAWTEGDGKASTIARRTAVANRIPPLLSCKRPGRLPHSPLASYLVLHLRTARWLAS